MKKTKSKSYRDSFEIRQRQIKIYKRTFQGTKYQSENWYARFKIPNNSPITRSLKVTDKDDAERIAESIFVELRDKSRKGISIQSKRFVAVINLYLSDYLEKVSMERDLPKYQQTYTSNSYKNRNLIASKFLSNYFKEYNIQDINDFDIESYINWRKVYWISGDGSKSDTVTYLRNGRKVKRPKNKSEKGTPSFGTLNKELTILRSIFEYARSKRIIDGKEVPTIKNETRPRDYNDKKSGLTIEEIKHITRTMAARHRKEKNPKHKRHLEILMFYIGFMSQTGLRVTEAKNLKISDFSYIKNKHKKYLKINVHGKGKTRSCIGLGKAADFYEKLKNIHKENSRIHKWKMNKDMYLFVDQYGKHVSSFSRGINRILEDAGLLFDEVGKKRTAGAFRKHYITLAILENIPALRIANQCGTSVSVIEKYYSEIKSHDQPDLFDWDDHAFSWMDK